MPQSSNLTNFNLHILAVAGVGIVRYKDTIVLTTYLITICSSYIRKNCNPQVTQKSV